MQIERVISVVLFLKKDIVIEKDIEKLYPVQISIKRITSTIL